ncbi:hypothetical protein BV898_13418 [Hypsibius exemplaris]|uniref:Uncharacterized protein n=1 Tax=Hypsibius exemplaris TaxID=2072580 RepID=A0A1W0WAQ5_HYPEX|nr:hypothetical protein BV898_13418 [Hypsibius exemplaris]
MVQTEDAERTNPVHQANYWRDHCIDENRREANWKSGYGKFLVGEQPKHRESKDKALRLPAPGRLSLGYDADIELDLTNRHIQRHFNNPQLHSHHKYPRLESYKVNFPERESKDVVHATHTDCLPKLETWAPPLPHTTSGQIGWLAAAPTDSFPGCGKPVRRRGDLAKKIGLPYEAW